MFFFVVGGLGNNTWQRPDLRSVGLVVGHLTLDIPTMAERSDEVWRVSTSEAAFFTRGGI